MSASAGRVLIKPKGVYNQAIAYKKQDLVFFNGSSYICINDTLGHAPTDSEYWQIMAQGAGVISGAFSGACDSLGSAQVKSVIIPSADNFALQKGVIVGVRFTNTNTFEATSENSIALNVNNTGALPIYFNGTATPLGDNVVAFGEAAYTHFYQYDGSNWVFIGRSGVQTAEQTPYDSTKSTKVVIDELADKLVTTSETVTGNPLSFNTDSAQPSQNTVITFEPIQSGSGDPSPSNVRPISGYDAIFLNVAKDNLCSSPENGGYAFATGEWYPAGINSYAYAVATVEAGKTYTASFGKLCGVQGIIFYDANDTFISYKSAPNPNVNYIIATAPTGATKAIVEAGGAPIIAQKDTIGYIVLEEGSTSIDISEPFPSTVYGGTLDVESGELVVDREIIDMGDIKNWSYYSTSAFFFCNLGITLKPTILCDIYKSEYGGSDLSIYVASNKVQIIVKDSSYGSNVNAFVTAVKGHKIVYALENPITYHLTPHQVKLLQGANVVTTNGISMTMKYRKGEIAKLEDLSEIGESVNVLSDTKMSYAANGKVGAKNLLPYPYIETTKTDNGITFTDLGDGKILVGGNSAQTASGNARFNCYQFYNNGKKGGYDTIHNQHIIFSGCPSGGSDSSYYMRFFAATDSDANIDDTGNGATFIYSKKESGTVSYVQIIITSGTTIPAGGITFEPMIRIAEDTDLTYQPYAMTNRELTERVETKILNFSDYITIDTSKVSIGTSRLAISGRVVTASIDFSTLAGITGNVIIGTNNLTPLVGNFFPVTKWTTKTATACLVVYSGETSLYLRDAEASTEYVATFTYICE